MALKAKIFKATINIANMDQHYYADHQLTIARHPSENDERMMLRILAFTLHASDNLSFTKGISTDDEPDIWERSLSGDIELWIDLGQPDEKRLRKACGRSRKVVLYNYGGKTSDTWWNQNETMTTRFNNLKVYNFPPETGKDLSVLTDKNMELQCTIQDDQIWLNNQEYSVQIEIEQRS
ncbi:hypothetical protein ACH42_03695 [Endozoicomonas sp. (ex Bugula neritina AB1)]|nr:hypothetical protein ACH42_03695 [Endozoicomonas sp. (ex Bugula neritina AB1)]